MKNQYSIEIYHSITFEKHRNWCLDHGLYESNYINSAFFKLFTEKQSMCHLDVQGFDYAIAYNKTKPIGLIIVENIANPYYLPMKCWHLNNKSKIPDIKINKNFCIYGNIGIYVDPDHRKQGIASSLTKTITDRMYQKQGQYMKDMPALSAHGKAEKITNNSNNNLTHAVFPSPVSCFANNYQYNSKWTSLFKDIIEGYEETQRVLPDSLINNAIVEHPKIYKNRNKTKLKNKLR